jgi:AcrR family transcriptional regulator
MGALSMRRVAADLGVATMTLYRHVPGKDELVLLMYDEVFGEEELPGAPTDWRAALELVARRQWALYRRHPWLARLISLTRPMLAPNAMAQTEWTMRALDGCGLRPSTVFHLAVVLAGLIQGIAAHLESEVEAQHDTGITSDEWMETQEARWNSIEASGRFPLLFDVAGQPDFDFDLDLMFELALRLVLDGLTAYVEERGGKPR